MTGLRDRWFIALQHLLPQHALGALVYRATRSRATFLKNALISSFVSGFHPEMGDAAEVNPLAYPTFNEFFTRALRAGARSVDPDLGTVTSPVDGSISQIGPLEDDQLLQAKGLYYTLDALLCPPPACAVDWAARLRGGSFATLYLAPHNYHRIHMPLAAALRESWYVPGSLFSVNATTAASVAGLFARNERVVCIFQAGALTFALILVGALCVGSMTTVWHGDITPRHPRAPALLPSASLSTLELAKGAEMGRFNMGSTVILLFPPNSLDWIAGAQPETAIRMGQPLARLRDPTGAEAR